MIILTFLIENRSLNNDDKKKSKIVTSGLNPKDIFSEEILLHFSDCFFKNVIKYWTVSHHDQTACLWQPYLIPPNYAIWCPEGLNFLASKSNLFHKLTAIDSQ